MPGLSWRLKTIRDYGMELARRIQKTECAGPGKGGCWQENHAGILRAGSQD
jgi:hypothetical protein